MALLTDEKPRTTGSAGEGYPTLLRIGHRYETTLGQLNALGALRGAQDIVLGADGWMYVLNRGSELPLNARLRIVRVNIADEGYANDILPDPETTPPAPQKGSIPSPVMGAIGRDGTLFITDERANTVSMFSTAGKFLGWWGESGSKPGQLNGPAGIAIDAGANLWIVDSRNHRVQRFTNDGKLLTCWGGFGAGFGQLSYPWGIAIDPVTGDIVVADWRNDRVQRFSSEGTPLQVVGQRRTGVGGLNRPSGVAVDKHGDIYVADRGSNRVLLFNYRGLFIESFLGDATLNEQGIRRLMGNPNMLRQRDNVANLDREKRLRHPTSVRVNNEGLVFIVDSGRNRIQVYRKLCRVLASHEVDPPSLHADPALN